MDLLRGQSVGGDEYGCGAQRPRYGQRLTGPRVLRSVRIGMGTSAGAGCGTRHVSGPLQRLQALHNPQRSAFSPLPPLTLHSCPGRPDLAELSEQEDRSASGARARDPHRTQRSTAHIGGAGASTGRIAVCRGCLEWPAAQLRSARPKPPPAFRFIRCSSSRKAAFSEPPGDPHSVCHPTDGDP